MIPKIDQYIYHPSIFTLQDSDYNIITFWIFLLYCFRRHLFLLRIIFYSMELLPEYNKFTSFSLSYPIMRLYNLLFHESRGARFVNVDFAFFTVFIFRGKHRDLKKKIFVCLATCIRYFIFCAHAGASLLNFRNFRGFSVTKELRERVIMMPDSDSFIMLQNCSRFIFFFAVPPVRCSG